MDSELDEEHTAGTAVLCVTNLLKYNHASFD